MTTQVAALAERIAAALARTRADVLIGDDFDTEAGSAAPIPAAVLVPIVDRSMIDQGGSDPAGPGVLLTRRTETLRHHAGQIAFPGGRMEAGETPEAAALREAQEEVGLDPGQVRVVGISDPYRTITGFLVTPVVGLIPPGLALKPSDGEVADVFEVPLGFVTDPANHVVRTLDWRGTPRTYFEIAWQDRRIWGATAAMIVNLSRRLAAR